MRPLLCLVALTVLPFATSCRTTEETPPTPPPPPEADCGNGMLEQGEVCEGMPTPVGCNPNTCQIQLGWACSPQAPDTQGGDTGGTFEPIEWMSTCEELDTCGDGVVDPGEQCDDGDMTLGDGCSMCTIDPLYTCMGEPSQCRQCGDGFLDEGEECDDGEEIGMDSPGCDQCRVVEGWTCFPSDAQISICGPRCGDGMWFDESVDGVTIGTAEGCDDGNMLDGDGCDGRCEIEAGCTCSGPSMGVSTCTCGMDGSDSGSTTGDMGSSDSGSSSSTT